ncbi:MAG: 2,3-bisphosphoglycerate-independent phosphoglycerate mutase, partial [Candidatus Yanofskybacteria bacterium]|nr:2,3-bisphosphoglycerate-independent phosphoglycerate mutase [Candidatus Yanofskybacteria bacterium]
LIDSAKKSGLTSVFIHLFTDGKDSGLKEAPTLIKKVQDKITEAGIGTIATLVGRMYAMDRDTNWDRTQKAFNLWTQGEGEHASDISTTLASAYEKGFNDTTLPALVFNAEGVVKENDAVVFFNFREDSMRQTAHAFLDPQFDKFPRSLPTNLFVALMTQYLEIEETPNVIFPVPDVKNGLAEVVSSLGESQLHIAETEKYAHTTYFFNCLHSKPFPGENDIVIPSDKDHTGHPEMRAKEIGETFVQEFSKKSYGLTVINFANADILSHTGNLDLAIKGATAIDSALKLILDAILAANGVMVITADHGNAESLTYTGTGEAETKHNLNPVPFHLVAQEYQRSRTPEEIAANVVSPQGIISDVAPTILELLQIPIPVEMTGSSLLPLIK